MVGTTVQELTGLHHVFHFNGLYFSSVVVCHAPRRVAKMLQSYVFHFIEGEYLWRNPVKDRMFHFGGFSLLFCLFVE